jgi:hypothetical protein
MIAPSQSSVFGPVTREYTKSMITAPSWKRMKTVEGLTAFIDNVTSALPVRTKPPGIEAVESADFLSEAQKRDIFYNNAARFLRLNE